MGMIVVRPTEPPHVERLHVVVVVCVDVLGRPARLAGLPSQNPKLNRALDHAGGDGVLAIEATAPLFHGTRTTP
jgi:hypothetical protein